MKAIGDKVLCEEIEHDLITMRKSGIIQVSKEDKRVEGKCAKVISVGERVEDIIPKDTIYFNYYDASHPYKLNNKTIYSIAEKLIWAKAVL